MTVFMADEWIDLCWLAFALPNSCYLWNSATRLQPANSGEFGEYLTCPYPHRFCRPRRLLLGLWEV